MQKEEGGKLEGGGWAIVACSPAGFILSFCAPLVTTDRHLKNAMGYPVFGISLANPLLVPRGSPIRTDSTPSMAKGLVEGMVGGVGLLWRRVCQRRKDE